MPPNTATARPGLIIFLGVLGIAVVLAIVVLIPLPSVDRELNGYIPRGAVEQTRSHGEMMSAVSLTTTQDVAGVLEFYGLKLKLSRYLKSRSGMTMMTRGRPFGGHYTDAIMPLSGGAGEAMTITHRESRHMALITIGRGTNESLTHLTVLLERLPGRENQSLWLPTNAALALVPPQGSTGSTGMGLGIAVAEFRTDLPFEDVARHYLTAGSGLLLQQSREQAQSVFVTKPRNQRQTFYVFCFRDNASTQTQVSVTWVAR